MQTKQEAVSAFMKILGDRLFNMAVPAWEEPMRRALAELSRGIKVSAPQTPGTCIYSVINERNTITEIHAPDVTETECRMWGGTFQRS